MNSSKLVVFVNWERGVALPDHLFHSCPSATDFVPVPSQRRQHSTAQHSMAFSESIPDRRPRPQTTRPPTTYPDNVDSQSERHVPGIMHGRARTGIPARGLRRRAARQVCGRVAMKALETVREGHADHFSSPSACDAKAEGCCG